MTVAQGFFRVVFDEDEESWIEVWVMSVSYAPRSKEFRKWLDKIKGIECWKRWDEERRVWVFPNYPSLKEYLEELGFQEGDRDAIKELLKEIRGQVG